MKHGQLWSKINTFLVHLATLDNDITVTTQDGNDINQDGDHEI